MKILLSIIFLFPSLAFAESLQVNYTEPSGTDFTKACVYICVQHNSSICTCVPSTLAGCQDNQNGTTAESTSISFNVSIQDGQLPACVNYGVATINSTGNKSALVYSTSNPSYHIFNPQ